MLLEDLLLAVVVAAVLLFAGRPIVRSIKELARQKGDPLAEAEERLRIAKRDAEAARLNREAEKIYDRMYEDALEGDREAPRPRVNADEKPETASEGTEKGRRHGRE